MEQLAGILVIVLVSALVVLFSAVVWREGKVNSDLRKQNQRLMDALIVLTNDRAGAQSVALERARNAPVMNQEQLEKRKKMKKSARELDKMYDSVISSGEITTDQLKAMSNGGKRLSETS